MNISNTFKTIGHRIPHSLTHLKIVEHLTNVLGTIRGTRNLQLDIKQTNERT